MASHECAAPGLRLPETGARTASEVAGSGGRGLSDQAQAPVDRADEPGRRGQTPRNRQPTPFGGARSGSSSGSK